MDVLQKLTLFCRSFDQSDRHKHFTFRCIMPVRYKCQNSLSFTQTIRLGTVRALGYAVNLAPGRCLCSLFSAYFRGGATISLPYLGTAHNLICPLLTSIARWARLTARSVQHGTRNGSPGVNPATFDARLSDIPSTAKQRIEDFAVCCQLVPSIPSLIRLLFVSPHLCLRLLSGWRYRVPLALG